MAPYVPEEVDVFSVPHSRMKQLVDSYFELIRSTNFSSTIDMEVLLDSLDSTFTEFQSHERIENQLIVKKLRGKMNSLAVSNSVVCNCHKESRLAEIKSLVRDGFNKSTVQDRINFGIKLTKELHDFTNTFLPHMKEEEEVFQPLLLEYFTYDELCQLKEKVIQQHVLKYQAQTLGLEKSAWVDRSIESSESEEDDLIKSPPDVTPEGHCSLKVTTSEGRHSLTVDDLPTEIILKLFGWLSPRDLARAAQVSKRWSSIAYDWTLWRNILPTQWSRGVWSFDIADDDDGCYGNCSIVLDDDADVDESEFDIDCQLYQTIQEEAAILESVADHLLPVVGPGVRKLVFANSKALNDKILQAFLGLCPNIQELNLSHSNITDRGLVRFNGRDLTKLILSGCEFVSDSALEHLAAGMRAPSSDHRRGNGQTSPSRSSSTPAESDDRLSRDDARKALHDTTQDCTGCWRDNGFVDFGCCGRDENGAELSRTVAGLDGTIKGTALTHLNLSGCWLITDHGLRALSRCSRYPELRYLDLSGCLRLTGAGLGALVDVCPVLDPSNLFYCDNIEDGPFSEKASGCRNLECGGHSCCRSGH